MTMHVFQKAKMGIMFDSFGKCSTQVPASANELASRLFSTVYLGTVNSSNETRIRAEALAAEVLAKP
jgi:hypothetical protein